MKQAYHITEELDHNSSLFYLSMHRLKEQKGLLSNKKEAKFDFKKAHNIAVFDIQKNEAKYLFDSVKEDESITHLLYEVNYITDNKSILFNRRSSRIYNNDFIEKRELLDQLLVCQVSEEKGLYRIWKFNKDGSDKTLITEIDNLTDWRFDVKNQKIITFKRAVNKVDFNAIDF